MLNIRRNLLLAAVTLVGAAVGPLASGTAEASDRLIRRCSVEGPGDISMTARFEREDLRRKFTVEMEAAPGGAFLRGQRIAFVVAGKIVGTDRLQTVVGGDLVGELNLDTQAGPGDDEDPFPPNFPPVNRGTKVRIQSGGEVVLACLLR